MGSENGTGAVWVLYLRNICKIFANLQIFRKYFANIPQIFRKYSANILFFNAKARIAQPRRILFLIKLRV